jgi:hypothetical protein
MKIILKFQLSTMPWSGFGRRTLKKNLENTICMHLKAAGYDDTVAQMGKREVDFVCDPAGERQYIQAVGENYQST